LVCLISCDGKEATAPGKTLKAVTGPYTLTINTLGSGTVSVSPNAASYAAGTLVTLTAAPGAGWSFSSWSGNLIGYANPATLIINGNSTVVATFDQDSYITGDPRTLTEPVFPLACTMLLAQQSATALNQSLFDTARLQTAINNCPVGQAVELSASGSNNAFLSQPIVLKAGVTLLIDAEVTLFASTNKADYTCDNGCTHFLTVAANPISSPGSAIMGYGTIDGQGSVWWGDSNRPRLVYVGDPATHAKANNFTLYKVTLQNAPQFNFYALSDNLTVWGVKITDPPNSPNTDGIDPSASNNITIRDSFISDGDDHIAMKAGIGHLSNVTIAHNHLYHGHGLSMGSETNGGANNILITDNVIDQNGCVNCTSSNDLRIKSDVSRGGEVKDVLYRDVCIRNAGTQPHEFVFTPYYTQGATGNLIPYFHDIRFQNIHMVDAGNTATFQGYDATKVLTLFMDNVVLDAYRSADFTSSYTSHAQFTLGPGKVSFAADLIAKAPADTNVTVINNITNPSVPTYDCTGRFVYLAGELFSKTNSVPSGQPITLTAIVQPIIFGAAQPTGTINILEGANVVATGTRNGRVTYITIPSVPAGSHTYTAQYSGDPNYAPLTFGSFTVTGQGGGTPDFALSATPSSATLTQGGSTTYTATVTPISGFSGQVALSVTGLPTGTNGSFNPASITGSGSSTLTISTSSATPAGSYPLTITGASGSLTHNTSVTLVVQAATAPDFTLSASPSSQMVTQGSSTAYTVSVAAVGGFSGTVSFSASGLPSGAVASFNPSSVNGSGSSTLGINTAASTPLGTYSVTATGTSGALSHSATVTLVVQASGAINVTAVSPANGASGIAADTPLRLTFSVVPTLGRSGMIRIFNAASGVAVDMLDMSAASFSNTYGTQVLHYTPVIISGNTAAIYPHSGVLSYNQTYYVNVDPSVFTDSAGVPFNGISGSNTWRFTTKISAPPLGADLTVAADGTGDFATVQGAINYVPANNTAPLTVLVKKGTYNELVYVGAGKNNVRVRGEDRTLTVIQYTNNESFNSGTIMRALFAVESATDFTLENLTLHNLTPYHGGQAEAFATKSGDRTIVRNVNFMSFMDTLMLNGRVYMEDSYLEGDTDMIWGTGVLYCRRCELKALHLGYYVQARNPASTYGYVFVDSTLTGVTGLSGYYLARNMGFSDVHVAYVNCKMGPQVIPAGWLPQGGTGLRFWEYQSTNLAGAPLDISQRDPVSRQLTAAEAAVMRDPTQVLGGWNPTPTPDFFLAATPGSQTVTAGASGTYTATVTASGGFTGTVSLSASGLPSGATASFNPDSIVTSGSSTLTVSTSGSTPAGSYPLTITAASGGLTHSSSVTLVVQAAAPADFNIAASPSSATARQGSSATYNITITSSGGFAGTVSLSASGLPSAATAGFNPGTVVGSGSSTLTISTAGTTPAGTYSLTITGTSGTLVHTAAVTLVVQATGAGDFSVSASPSSQSVDSGNSISYSVSVAGTGGFAGAVMLSVTGLPPGGTASFSPTSVAGSGTSSMTIDGENLSTGSYLLTITGTSGSLSHSTRATLIVN
jgi:polygalacturonase/uncharacterized membrane protein